MKQPTLEQIDEMIDNGKTRIKVTTVIDINIFRKIHEGRIKNGGGYGYNELIGLGLLARSENPQLIRRIRSAEVNNAHIDQNIKKILNVLERVDSNISKLVSK